MSSSLEGTHGPPANYLWRPLTPFLCAAEVGVACGAGTLGCRMKGNGERMMSAFWNLSIYRESPTSPPARHGVRHKHALYLSFLLHLSTRDGQLEGVCPVLGTSPQGQQQEFQKAPVGSSVGGSFAKGRVLIASVEIWGYPLLGQVEGTVGRERCGT